jgi:post-segregation antitoxin (ccd killing protein)
MCVVTATHGRRIRLSVRRDLVRRARASGIDVSRVVERALEEAVQAEQARWLADNNEAIAYYNAFVEENGMFGVEPAPTPVPAENEAAIDHYNAVIEKYGLFRDEPDR